MSYLSVFLSYSFAYMFLFFVSYGNLILSSAKERAVKLFVCYMCFAFPFVLVLFSGLRWECGTDWNSYKKVFDLVVAGSQKIEKHFDKGYVILNRFAALFSDDYTFFLLIDSLIAIALVVIGLKRIGHISFIIALHMFFTNYFCGIYMGSNRRIIAIGLCLNALISFSEKKYCSYLIFQGLAFFFHRTSLIFILILFIPRKCFTYRKIAFYLFLTMFIGFFKPTVQLIKTVCQLGENLTGKSIFSVGVYYITVSYPHL
ncbi:MAG: EpsG family protein, partial [Treponemataceae bacterium]|nr:EpsG family protein [Treponemataceae bacterium]